MDKTTPFKKKSYDWLFMHRRKIGPSDDDVYLDRVYLVKAPWFSVMFHRIYRPDKQCDLHDHPWPFLSIVLRGHYMEEYRGAGRETDTEAVRRRVVRWWNLKRTWERHRIQWCSRSPVWTLVFTGGQKRTWGFWVDNGTRFIRWQDYEKLYNA